MSSYSIDSVGSNFYRLNSDADIKVGYDRHFKLKYYFLDPRKGWILLRCLFVQSNSSNMVLLLHDQLRNLKFNTSESFKIYVIYSNDGIVFQFKVSIVSHLNICIRV